MTFSSIFFKFGGACPEVMVTYIVIIYQKWVPKASESTMVPNRRFYLIALIPNSLILILPIPISPIHN